MWRKNRRIFFIIIGLPFLITLFVGGGALLGLYLAEQSGDPPLLYSIFLSTVGLAISICASYVIARIVTSK